MQTLAQLKNGELAGAVSLKLSEDLSVFPEEIFDLLDTLAVLDLSGNQLKTLPADFGKLQKLKIFFCSDNLFTSLPGVLADCPLLDIVGFKANLIDSIPPRALNPNLRWLILTNNRIPEVPAAIGHCKNMQKLMLAGNRLTTLPEELRLCYNLSLLRISANLLEALPPWLLNMPRLSWLAFSGNPFSEKPELQEISTIKWSQMEIGKVLGEGASGVIYQARLNEPGVTKDIAVKIFKGTVTSDGLPEDEMKTCILAGSHSGLVPVIGQIDGHPEQKKGLAMELIHSRFYNLGGPPNMDSCTRDTFKPEAKLSLQQALKIATTIASVAAQLHDQGIMHGDLYAHNILTDVEGSALFGDFGAASFYSKTKRDQAGMLERLEVRAYGWLLDDLIHLCREEDADALADLEAMRDNCLNEIVDLRPNFSSIALSLNDFTD